MKLWEPETFTAAAELYLAAIMICATFRDSDESLNLVRGKKNAVRLVLSEQKADLKKGNSDGWRQLHSFTTARD